MKLILSTLLIVIINSIFSQNDDIDLSKIKLCETKISDLKESFNLIPVNELDVCPNGVSPLKRPEYQYKTGYTISSFKNVTFQILLADSTICRIILDKDFKGYLTDGKYINMSTLKAKDIKDKQYWFKNLCSEYIGLGSKNMKFYIKQDESILSENTIDQEFYSQKNIEIITIESNCFKQKK